MQWRSFALGQAGDHKQVQFRLNPPSCDALHFNSRISQLLQCMGSVEHKCLLSL